MGCGSAADVLRQVIIGCGRFGDLTEPPKKKTVTRGSRFSIIRKTGYLSARTPDIPGSRAFLSLLQFELNFFALTQGLESVTLDGAEMHEDVFAVFSFDEPETFGFVEPLHFTLHDTLCCSFHERPSHNQEGYRMQS